jgi:hypothetical protein
VQCTKALDGKSCVLPGDWLAFFGVWNWRERTHLGVLHTTFLVMKQCNEFRFINLASFYVQSEEYDADIYISQTPSLCIVMTRRNQLFLLYIHTLPLHRYISSNGLVSLKHPSHTEFTISPACFSSFTPGLAIILSVARLLTQCCNCSVTLH